ncbi:hypothetical protein M5E02_03360 [Bacillus safensis]|uniref:hypothetical protein n=1 Tax=Bacillus safensis TaxID=561879 RepID=UPI002074C7E5|nr:hypothetical protein [Bacillus safensis]USD83473.1 hypothetical protein M5E02_03360 [Bacillus safensis]
MDVVTRCVHRESSVEEIMIYTGKSKSYVKSAISAAILLGMIEQLNGDIYKISDDCYGILNTTPSEELKTSLFKSRIEKWEPFILYLKYLISGESSVVAIRKLCSLYSFNRTPVQIENLLKNWAKSTGILDATGEIVDINLSYDENEILYKLNEETVNDTNVSLFMINILGENIFSWLYHDEIAELKKAILIFRDHPRDAIQCSGRAFEDVLRRISIQSGVDTRKLNGITQVANNLYSQLDSTDNPFIHSKLKNIASAIGDIRNMAGHGKEAKSMERWELSSTSAIAHLLLTLSTIKGIYSYVNENRYDF